MNLKGKTVLITGASSGIGRQAAIEFARSGSDLILVARRQELLDRLKNELAEFNVSIAVHSCDVSKRDQVLKMSRSVLENSFVDILVNNAGFAVYGSVSDLSIDQIEAQMQTNYFGMVYCTKAFLPSMLKNNSGHIVNVASVAASFGLPGIASYCASKFAMLGFSEGLWHELRGTKIGITVVSPIMVRTGFFDHPSFEKMPHMPISLDPMTAAKAIMRACNSSRLEIIVPGVVRGAVWFKHTFPFFTNLALKRSIKNYSPASSASEPTSSCSSDFNSN